MDWYAETWFLSSKLSPSREGGQDLSVACPRSMALCGRARGADGSRKEAKTQRKPRTGLCDAWCGAPSFVTPIHIPTGREATGGLRWANTHRLRSVNRLSSTCVMLSRAERWVSRSVVNCADARGGIWDVEVVEEIRGRPLHHTLLNIESQQAVLSVSSSALPSFIPPDSRPSGRRRAEGITAVDLTVLGVRFGHTANNYCWWFAKSPEEMRNLTSRVVQELGEHRPCEDASRRY